MSMIEPWGQYPSDSILTVSQLNQAVASLLEGALSLCSIEGEVSNFTAAASGHWYFTLKDASAQVRAVMFKHKRRATDFLPKNGEKIEVRAMVTLYTPRGDYQLSVESIKRSGLGHLYEAFLKLKATLQARGFFDQARKKTLPYFPSSIGMITSPKGAALHDMLTTFRRRAPYLRIVIYPTPVQGGEAVDAIVAAIEKANRHAVCDVLLLARGGGSMEDLWAFNEEKVAVAMTHSRLPIVTGVGHETDYTIADFVADARAPTPTAAAEIVTRSQEDWLNVLRTYCHQLQRAMTRYLNVQHQTVDNVSYRLLSPAHLIEKQRLQLTQLSFALKHALGKRIHIAQAQLHDRMQRLMRRRPEIIKKRQLLEQYAQHIRHHMRYLLERQQQGLLLFEKQLIALSPHQIMKRGYAIAFDAKGAIIRSPEGLRAPCQITLQLDKGAVILDVDKITPSQ